MTHMQLVRSVLLEVRNEDNSVRVDEAMAATAAQERDYAALERIAQNEIATAAARFREELAAERAKFDTAAAAILVALGVGDD